MESLALPAECSVSTEFKNNGGSEGETSRTMSSGPVKLCGRGLCLETEGARQVMQ